MVAGTATGGASIYVQVGITMIAAGVQRFGTDSYEIAYEGREGYSSAGEYATDIALAGAFTVGGHLLTKYGGKALKYAEGKLMKLEESLTSSFSQGINAVENKVFRQVENAVENTSTYLSGKPNSIKHLKMELGRAGMKVNQYKIVKAAAEEVARNEQAFGKVWGWMSRDGLNNIIADKRGRPIINLTERALESWETAVKTLAHEIKHIRDAKAGMTTLSEAAAEEYAERYWQIFQKRKQ